MTVTVVVSMGLATTHVLSDVMVDPESAMSAETVPIIRRSPNKMIIPAFARMSNTLEKYDALVKYIKLFILKRGYSFDRFKKYGFKLDRLVNYSSRPRALVFSLPDIPGYNRSGVSIIKTSIRQSDSMTGILQRFKNARIY
jgi:hypothetical protein